LRRERSSARKKHPYEFFPLGFLNLFRGRGHSMSGEPNVISRPALSARAYAGRAGATGVCGGHLGRIRRVFLAFQVPNNKGKPGRRSWLCRRRSCGSKIEEIGRFICINQPSVALTVLRGVTRTALFRLDFTPLIADDLIMAGGGFIRISLTAC
jgi:hypothetical protein